MKGFIKSVVKRQVESKNNNTKFWVYDLKIAVVENERGDVKTYEHSMSKDFFDKYMSFCGYEDIKQIIGLEVNVTIGERTYISSKDGKRKFIDVIKFMNFIDENGESIIMKNE